MSFARVSLPAKVNLLESRYRASQTFGTGELIGRGEFAEVYETVPTSEYVIKKIRPRLPTAARSAKKLRQLQDAAFGEQVDQISAEIELTRAAGGIAPELYGTETIDGRDRTITYTMERMQSYIDTPVNALVIIELINTLVTELQMVHNDLHMGNIMCDRQGKPRLIDFGFARHISEPMFEAERGDTARALSQIALGQVSFLVFACNKNNGGCRRMESFLCDESVCDKESRRNYGVLREQVERHLESSAGIVEIPNPDLRPYTKLLLSQVQLMKNGIGCEENYGNMCETAAADEAITDLIYDINQCGSDERADELWRNKKELLNEQFGETGQNGRIRKSRRLVL